ncbi:MAG: T9SS type A sorting domain-containing protein [Ignavibacteriae bacterium]|nr:T9SS type A sorting domain-containing protein [Ignavibacteriota bacterium]
MKKYVLLILSFISPLAIFAQQVIAIPYSVNGERLNLPSNSLVPVSVKHPTAPPLKNTLIETDSLISGVVNIYTPVLAIDNACFASVTVGNSTGFNNNDKVLIIQMQGAEIDTTNTSQYGKITAFNNAGNYEFARIRSVNTNTIFLNSPLLRSYSIPGKVQLVRVPEYRNVVVRDTLSGKPWNDTVGGIIVISVSNTLTLRAPIVASRIGFRGAEAHPTDDFPKFQIEDYVGTESLPGYRAAKGEGIAGYGVFPFINGRGAPANGGGGGNNHNGGGGGGANLGSGGKGGLGWYNYRGNIALSQGEGGYQLTNTNNQIFLGGGGGAGHTNQSVSGKGGSGGGLIIIETSEIVSEDQSIQSDGYQGGDALEDSGGGGGSGGTVLLSAETFSGMLSINCRGGRGGNNTYIGGQIAPGGGGGGGGVYFSLSAKPSGTNINISEGVAGIIVANKQTLEASAGKKGDVFFNLKIPENNTVNTLINAGEDKTICLGDSVQLGVEPESGSIYSWQPSIGLSDASIANPIAYPKQTTTYILTVNNSTRCIDSVLVTVKEPNDSKFTLTPSNIPIFPGEQFQASLNIPKGVQSWRVQISYSDPVVKFDSIVQTTNGIMALISESNGKLTISGTGSNGNVVMSFNTFLPHNFDSTFTMDLANDSTPKQPCESITTRGSILELSLLCAPKLRIVNFSGKNYFLTNKGNGINFGIGLLGNVRLELYDYTGSLMEVLLNERLNVGEYSIDLDLPTGVYFCRLSAGMFNDVQKIMVVQNH